MRKKLLLFVLSVIMLLCLGVSVYASDGNVYDDDSTGWEISFVNDESVNVNYGDGTHDVLSFSYETENIIKLEINGVVYYYELDSASCKAKQVDAGYVAKKLIDDSIGEISDGVDTFWNWVVMILASCGISLSTIIAVIKWIKEKLNKGNVEIKTITAVLEKTTDELKAEKDKVIELVDTTRNLIETLSKNYNLEKEKQAEINKVINEVLNDESE